MKKVIINVPDGTDVLDAVKDVAENLRSYDSSMGLFGEAVTPNEISYSIEDVFDNEVGILCDDYRMVNVFGTNGFSVLVHLKTDKDMGEDEFLRELVNRGILSETDAKYADVDSLISDYDVEQWNNTGAYIIEL